MADTELAPPKPYWFVTVFNLILDFAINGMGGTAAKTAIVAQVPWLPVGLVNWVVDTFLGDAEKRIEKGADKVIVRFSKDIRRDQYEATIKPLREKGKMTDEELKAAEDAIHRLLHHGDD